MASQKTKKLIELKPIIERPADWDDLEEEILRIFREEIYLPLIRELGLKNLRVQNSLDALVDALNSGEVVYKDGYFTGNFNAGITKELRKLGAEWDRQSQSFRLYHYKLPIELRPVIAASEARFAQVTERVKKKIGEVVPKEVAAKLKVERLFDRQLWKTEGEFQKSVKSITIAPKLTREQAARISAEYTQNLQLYIEEFTQQEIVELRKNVEERAFKGERYEDLVKEIERSYGVSARKAKFLARQETSLMMTKYKQTKYEESGVNEYIWTCVEGSPAHPVRPMHKALNGKTFRWDQPPVVDEQGSRKNPGQDFNCRCYARPIIRF